MPPAIDKASENDHQFDRRAGDSNVAALALRVGILEGRMENVEHEMQLQNRELAANTKLTSQTHEAVERIEANTQGLIETSAWLKTSRRAVTAIASAGATAATIAVGVFEGLRYLHGL